MRELVMVKHLIGNSWSVLVQQWRIDISPTVLVIIVIVLLKVSRLLRHEYRCRVGKVSIE
jgi:hypothetical protein